MELDQKNLDSLQKNNRNKLISNIQTQLLISLLYKNSNSQITNYDSFKNFISSNNISDQDIINNYKQIINKSWNENLILDDFSNMWMTFDYVLSNDFLSSDFYIKYKNSLHNWFLQTIKNKLIEKIYILWLEENELNYYIENIWQVQDIDWLQVFFNTELIISDNLLEEQKNFISKQSISISDLVSNLDNDFITNLDNNEDIQSWFIKSSCKSEVIKYTDDMENYFSGLSNIFDTKNFIKEYLWEELFNKVKNIDKQYIESQKDKLNQKWFNIDDKFSDTLDQKDLDLNYIIANILLLDESEIDNSKKKFLLNNFSSIDNKKIDFEEFVEILFSSSFSSKLENYFSLPKSMINNHKEFITNLLNPNQKELNLYLWNKYTKLVFDEKKIFIDENMQINLNLKISQTQWDNEVLNLLKNLWIIDDNLQISNEKIWDLLYLNLSGLLTNWLSIDESVKSFDEDLQFNENMDWNETLSLINNDWKKIKWDKDAEFNIWSSLAFRVWESIYPWWWSQWWFMEITSEPKILYNWKVKIEANFYCWETNEYFSKKIEINYEQFSNFLNKEPVSWVSMKFKTIDSSDEFLKYIKNINLEDYKWFKNFKEKWLNLKEKWWKFFDSDNNQIDYVWMEYDEYNESWNSKKIPLLYYIKYLPDWIILGNENLSPKEKKMSYNAFSIFCSEKWLNPYTKEDAEMLKNKINANPDKKMKSNGLSISAMLISFKSIKDNYLERWKSEDELRASQFYMSLLDSKIASVIPGSIVSELRQEAFSEYDSKLWSIINKHKDRLSRDGAVHDKEIVNVIKNEVFEKKWSSKDKLKAAGYLLHSLEKWWGPYYRWLKKYSWSWAWVNAILWPEYLKVYQNNKSFLISQLKKTWDNETLQNELARLELDYIKDTVGSEKMRKIFGSKFQWALDWAISTNFSSSKVDEMHNNMSSKSNFEMVYNDLNWIMKWAMPARQIWTLRALSEKVDHEWHYQKWYWMMLLPIISWEYLNWDETLKTEYMKIAWTYSFPVGFFVNTYKGPEKIVKLFDYISKWSNEFSSFTSWSMNTISPDSGADKKEKIQSKFLYWWASNWSKISSFLSNSDLDNWAFAELKKLENLQNLNKEQKEIKEILWEYKDIVLKKWKDIPYDSKLKPNEAIPYMKSILHIWPKLADSSMKSHNWRDFNNPLWRGLWNIFNWTLKKYEFDVNINKFEYIMWVYSTWFVNVHSNTYSDILQSILHSKSDWKSKSETKKEIMSMFENCFGTGINRSMPSQMRQWLELLSSYIANNISNISNDKLESVLYVIFKQENVVSAKKKVDEDPNNLDYKRNRNQNPNLGWFNF